MTGQLGNKTPVTEWEITLTSCKCTTSEEWTSMCIYIIYIQHTTIYGQISRICVHVFLKLRNWGVSTCYLRLLQGFFVPFQSLPGGPISWVVSGIVTHNHHHNHHEHCTFNSLYFPGGFILGFVQDNYNTPRKKRTNPAGNATTFEVWELANPKWNHGGPLRENPGLKPVKLLVGPTCKILRNSKGLTLRIQTTP